MLVCLEINTYLTLSLCQRDLSLMRLDSWCSRLRAQNLPNPCRLHVPPPPQSHWLLIQQLQIRSWRYQTEAHCRSCPLFSHSRPPLLQQENCRIKRNLHNFLISQALFYWVSKFRQNNSYWWTLKAFLKKWAAANAISPFAVIALNLQSFIFIDKHFLSKYQDLSWKMGI